MIGKTKYPIIVKCDNKSAITCSRIDRCHELKTLDGDVYKINKSLEIRKNTRNE